MEVLGPGPHSRVGAAVALSDIWGPQLLHQDSDDADEQDEVYLGVAGREGPDYSSSAWGLPAMSTLAACLLGQIPWGPGP